MDKNMTSVAVTGVAEFTTCRTPIPQVTADTVLIQVAYCGICGSDIPRYFSGGVHSFPQVLGHEFSGVVAAIGENVTNIKQGDHVTVAPLVPCHECEQCRSGNPSLCPEYSFIGSRQPGAFAEFVLVPAANVVAVTNLDLEIAALVEPMTVALHALNKATVEHHHPIAILGSGVIGLLTLIAARNRGFSNITVTDIDTHALDIATQFGATAVINPLKTDVTAYFSDHGYAHLVLETAGAASSRNQALSIAAKNGTVVFIGTPTTDWVQNPVTFEQILRKELTLKGSWMSYSSPFPGSEWTEAIEILSALGPQAHEIISHVFDLSEAATGFAVIDNTKIHRLKIMFRVNPPKTTQQ